MIHNRRDNILDNDITTISQVITDVAFMDDTTWCSSSKESMETIMSIADSFYQLNNILVNDDKAIILTNNTKDIITDTDNQQYINMTYLQHQQRTQVKINVVTNNMSTRILGVWINSNCNKRFVYNQLKKEVDTDCLIMKNKFLTDKQLLYIYNNVIIPRMEYKSQLTGFSEKVCKKLQSPYLTLLKQKLKLPKTCPNSIFYNRLIYKFKDLYETKMQSMITNFFIQINDKKLLGMTTQIRLRQIQDQWCLAESPLVSWKVDNTCKYSDQLTFTINYIHQYNITIQINDDLKDAIIGGKFPLSNILSHAEIRRFNKSLINYNIRFLSQLLSPDGLFLINRGDFGLINVGHLKGGPTPN
jgi:hypothetical protein